MLVRSKVAYKVGKYIVKKKKNSKNVKQLPSLSTEEEAAKIFSEHELKILFNKYNRKGTFLLAGNH